VSTFQLDIVSAERHVSSDQVEVLVVPGAEGEMAILPSHSPLLTVLKPGEIRIVKDGEDSFIAVSGGFMEVMPEKVTILADTAERLEEIDIERAEAALKAAQERIATAPVDMDLQRALASLRRSQARVKVARRRRNRPL
jgi:F-type H+-transporting ATPase subunit epsilon